MGHAGLVSAARQGDRIPAGEAMTTPPNPPTLDLETLEMLERMADIVPADRVWVKSSGHATLGFRRDEWLTLVNAGRDLERLKAEAAERDADPQTSAGWWRAKAKGFEAELHTARERIGVLEGLLGEAVTCGVESRDEDTVCEMRAISQKCQERNGGDDRDVEVETAEACVYEIEKLGMLTLAGGHRQLSPSARSFCDAIRARFALSPTPAASESEEP
jgi:hypothetical protein